MRKFTCSRKIFLRAFSKMLSISGSVSAVVYFDHFLKTKSNMHVKFIVVAEIVLVDPRRFQKSENDFLRGQNIHGSFLGGGRENIYTHSR